MFEQARDFLPQVAMPIANRKEVTVFKAKHVWVGDVGVLVDFIGVVCCDASLCRKGELRYTVV